MNNSQKTSTFPSWLCVLVIVALGFLAYSFALGAPFRTLDDEVLILNNPAIQSFQNIPQIFTSSFFGGDMVYYRPLIILSYLFEYHFFTLNPFFYYLDNILLHLASAVLVFFFVKEIFRDTLTGFAAGLLFAVHPVHWEAVSNVAGRAIVLCAVFYFLAFFAYGRAQSRRSNTFYLLALVAYVLSLLCKESAVTFTVILAGYEFFIVGKSRVSKVDGKASLLRLLPFAGLTVLYFFLRAALKITVRLSWQSPTEAFLGVSTFFKGLFTYLQLVVVPVDLYFDRATKYFVNPLDPGLLMVDGFFLGVFLLGVLNLKKFRPETRFFVFWACAAFLPYSQLVPILNQQGYAATPEHFLYIPLAGILVVLIRGARTFLLRLQAGQLVRPPLAKAFIVGAYAFFFLTTVQQNIYASRDYAMLEHSLENNPHNVRVRNSYAFLLARDYHFAEAESQYRQALAELPDNNSARIGLGAALSNQGKILEALDEFDKVRSPGNQAALLELNKKLVLRILVPKYEKKVAAAPDDARAQYSLGLIYSRAENYPRAIECYQRAVRLDPGYQNALFNLASTLLIEGDEEGGILYFQQLLSAGQGTTDLELYAAHKLAEIFQSRDDALEAERYAALARTIEGHLTEANPDLRVLSYSHD